MASTSEFESNESNKPKIINFDLSNFKNGNFEKHLSNDAMVILVTRQKKATKCEPCGNLQLHRTFNHNLLILDEKHNEITKR